jgi:acetyl-CoA carboxylase biotin carboxyl carrier protein
MANGRKAQKNASATATNRKQWPAEPSEQEGGSGAGSGNEDLVTIVRGLAAAVAEHNLSELVVDTPEVTFTLRRGVATVAAAVAVPQVAPIHVPAPMHVPASMSFGGLGSVGVAAAPPPPSHAATIAAAAPAYDAAAATPTPVIEEKGHVVTSPFVGTFYRKPNPDSPDYVKLGDKVKKGTVLCIVEAMKLMNEIEAEFGGTVLEVLVQNGQPVEFGQGLFVIDAD